MMNVVVHEHVLHAFTPGDRHVLEAAELGYIQFTLDKSCALCGSSLSCSFPRVKSASHALRIGRALSC